MSNRYNLKMQFWGVRGSTPTPRIENLNFGGNTSCIEVRAGQEEVFIFDAGTGIIGLGQQLVEEFGQRPMHLKIFLTHFHWDHIQGLPFFQPLYSAENKVEFYSHANLAEDLIRGQMSGPYFPVGFEFLPAQMDFLSLDHSPTRVGDVQITPFALNHPQGATGYRIERDGACIVYASDMEHGDPHFDRLVRDHSASADLLVYDATYTPEEYEERVGWGHSTWMEAARVAEDSDADHLFLFHHDPLHTDSDLVQIVSNTRLFFEKVSAACEGTHFIL